MSLPLLGRAVLALLAVAVAGGALLCLLMAREVRTDVRARREQRLRGEGRG